MRITFKNISHNFRNQWTSSFGDTQRDRQLVTRIVSLETMIRAFEVAFPEVPLTLKNIQSVFVNQDSILHPSLHPEVIEVARVYFHSFIQLNGFRQLVREYENVDKDYRIYVFDAETELFFPHSPAFFPYRKKNEYDVYLNPRNLKHQEVESKSYIKKGDKGICFYRYIAKSDEKAVPVKLSTNDGIYNQTKEGKTVTIKKAENYDFIPEGWMEDGYESLESIKTLTLPKKKKKNELNLPLNPSSFLKIAKQMDFEPNKEREWVEAQKALEIQALDPQTGELDLLEQYIDFSKSFSIAGLVGAGKTTALTMMTYHIVKNCGGKVGIITGKTIDTLDTVMTLRNLGIKAVPIYSAKSEASKKSMEEFFEAVAKKAKKEEVNPLLELMNHPLMQYHGAKCAIHAYTDTKQEFNERPCDSLYIKNGEKSVACKCPLVETCGVYKIQAELEEAEVWVGTAQALVMSAPMNFFDTQNRSYLSYMKDKMDVIFADEADKLQEVFDDAFKTELNLFGDKDSAFEQFYREGKNRILNYQLSANDYKVNLFSKYLDLAYSNVRFIYGLLKATPYIQNELSRQTFVPGQLLKKITEILFPTSDECNTSLHTFYQMGREKFKNEEEVVVKKGKKSIHKKLNPYIEQITTAIDAIRSDSIYESEEERFEKEIETFEHMLKEHQMKVCHALGIDPLEFHTKKERERWTEMVKLYACYHYLSSFDRLFQSITALLPYVSEALNVHFNDLDKKYKSLEEFFPFIPTSPTGKTLQYRYDKAQERTHEKIAKFYLFEYKGIGRELLTNLQGVAKGIDGEGATMVFLSGTSYAIGSPNYHVNVDTKYVLRSTKAMPKIEHFRHIVVDGNDKPIFVSGQKTEEKKLKALRQITIAMIPEIKKEIEFWKKHEQEENRDRKVILVVNAYSQVQTVVETLKWHFEGKVKGLVNGKEIGKHESLGKPLNMEDYVATSEIEDIAIQEVDVLVVPLLAINRGYNILKRTSSSSSSSSYFGSQFFLVRPYVISNDIGYVISVLNGAVPSILDIVKKEGKSFGQAASSYRRLANARFESLVSSNDGWAGLNDFERRAIAWYTFVNVFQMIGRSLRGNTDMRVHWVDGKFHFNRLEDYHIGTNEQQTMLQMWESILQENPSYISSKLYDVFTENLSDALKDDVQKHQLAPREENI